MAVERRQGMVLVRVTGLLALLAVLGERIVSDPAETAALEVVGPAAGLLALGAVCRAGREQDRRLGEGRGRGWRGG